MRKIKIIFSFLKDKFLSIFLFCLAIFCLIRLFLDLENSFNVVANSLGFFLIIFYYLKFEKDEVFGVIKMFGGDASLNFIFLYKKRWVILKYSFLFLLFLLLMTDFFEVSFLINYSNLFYVLTIINGGVLFWHNWEKNKKQIEAEQNRKNLEELKKQKEFLGKFSQTSKIPIFRNILKWMYCEGWWCVLILFVILLNGFLLRYDNLDSFPFQVDEYQVLETSKGLYETGDFVRWDFQENKPLVYLTQNDSDEGGTELYTRGKPYTYLTYFYVKYFQAGEFNERNVRFPVVMIGTLFLLVFYYFLRLINISREVTLITTYLASVFPLFIWHSRYARMYGLVLLLFFIILILFICLIRRLLVSNKKLSVDIWRNLWLIALILIVFFIGCFTHKNYFLVLLPIIITFLIFHKIPKIRKILVGGGVISLVILLVSIISGFFPYYHLGFFSNIHFEYFDYSLNVISENFQISFLLFLIPLLLLYIKDKRFPILFSSLTVFSVLYFFVFFTNRYWDSRYAIFIWPFILVLMVLGIELIAKSITKRYPWVLMILLIFFLTPYNLTLYRVDLEHLFHGYLFTTPISHETKLYSKHKRNYQYFDIYQFLKNNMKEDDILIGASLKSYYLYRYNIANEKFDFKTINNISEDAIYHNRLYIYINKRGGGISENSYWKSPQYNNIYIYLRENIDNMKLVFETAGEAIYYFEPLNINQ